MSKPTIVTVDDDRLVSAAITRDLTSQYGELLDALNTAMLDTHTKRDYSDVFAKYIHN